MPARPRDLDKLIDDKVVVDFQSPEELRDNLMKKLKVKKTRAYQIINELQGRGLIVVHESWVEIKKRHTPVSTGSENPSSSSSVIK